MGFDAYRCRVMNTRSSFLKRKTNITLQVIVLLPMDGAWRNIFVIRPGIVPGSA
jgi:hypothetical protein